MHDHPSPSGIIDIRIADPQGDDCTARTLCHYSCLGDCLAPGEADDFGRIGG
ncbi:MAG TPA: hypothetical protein VFR81_27045 [Longimicrobium sp.]|nr:hypothetical protein [Longimicrobium sp.]